ncbi:hypothetical protein [Hymenobacter cavernae]|uniref:Uncharacterized protein n=1 Tax=Hymenobacter cavernae TaxID=2044852 RepID=A0ABQ1TWC5_9BACT|nr:hypothetical protein [Hymenobacter cavernae]GGF04968.1 hypothetical protein GCM10011383_15130 [Hymenobacter cavernae]
MKKMLTLLTLAAMMTASFTGLSARKPASTSARLYSVKHKKPRKVRHAYERIARHELVSYRHK